MALTVDKILKSFNKTMVQLETLQAKKDRELEAELALRESSILRSASAQEERDRARRIAAKIKELVD